MIVIVVAYDIRDAIQTYSFSSILAWNAFERNPLPREKVLQPFTREYHNIHKVCGLREAAVALAIWKKVSLQISKKPQTQCLGFKDFFWTLITCTQ